VSLIIVLCLVCGLCPMDFLDAAIVLRGTCRPGEGAKRKGKNPP
jgi:hypothetical protein